MRQDNPYVFSSHTISGDIRPSTQEQASRGSRLVAVLIDTAILLVPGIGAALAFPGVIERGLDSSAAMPLLAILLLFVLAYLGYNLNLMHTNGQTVGKKYMGIKVVRTDGSRLSLGRWLVLRVLSISILGFIPVVGKFATLVDCLFIFRDSRQCLHDQIADTMVIVA